jgi:replicative DNA helicase
MSCSAATSLPDQEGWCIVIAHPEELLISAVLRSGDFKTTVQQGLSTNMFIAFVDEWKFISQHVQKHGAVPGKESFKQKFPEFVIMKADDVAVYCDDVKQEYARDTVTRLIDEAIDQIQAGQIDKAMTALGTELLRTQTILADVEDDYNVTSDYERTVRLVQSRIDRASTTGWAGVPTGLGTIDLMSGGVQPGWLTIIGGRLSAGKTWLLVRMAVEAAMKGYSAMFYSLEQGRDEIAMRTHTLFSRMMGPEVFRASDLQRGYGLDMTEYRSFLSGLEDNLLGRLVINDSSRGKVSPMTVAAAIEREQPDIVFIDYLTLMSMKGDGGWLSVADLSASLKQLALRYQIPVVVGSQLNRSAVRDNTPDASTLSRSDSVGHDADLIITVAHKTRSVRVVNVPKFRHGSEPPMFYIKWKPNTGDIEEISGDQASLLMDEDKLVD